MDRVLYVLGALAFTAGLFCETPALGSGSPQERVGEWLLALSPLLMIAGLLTYLLASKRCQRCRERVRRLAPVCHHCGHSVGALLPELQDDRG